MLILAVGLEGIVTFISFVIVIVRPNRSVVLVLVSVPVVVVVVINALFELIVLACIRVCTVFGSFSFSLILPRSDANRRRTSLLLSLSLGVNRSLIPTGATPVDTE